MTSGLGGRKDEDFQDASRKLWPVTVVAFPIAAAYFTPGV
jgi:hypothetical protein